MLHRSDSCPLGWVREKPKIKSARTECGRPAKEKERRIPSRSDSWMDWMNMSLRLAANESFSSRPVPCWAARRECPKAQNTAVWIRPRNSLHFFLRSAFSFSSSSWSSFHASGSCFIFRPRRRSIKLNVITDENEEEPIDFSGRRL